MYKEPKDLGKWLKRNGEINARWLVKDKEEYRSVFSTLISAQEFVDMCKRLDKEVNEYYQYEIIAINTIVPKWPAPHN